MNQFNLIGRLTKDPESYVYGPKGKEEHMAIYTMAVQRDKDNADFIRCKSFGKTADVILDYVKKGQMIAVSGEIRTGSYENDNKETIYTTDFIASRMWFCGGASNPDNKDSHRSRRR